MGQKEEPLGTEKRKARADECNDEEFARRLAALNEECWSARREGRYGLVQFMFQAGNIEWADFGKRIRFNG